jgi:hypothetical protein
VHRQLLIKILRNDFEPLPMHFSRPFQQLVSMMLRADPDDRPTAARLKMLPKRTSRCSWPRRSPCRGPRLRAATCTCPKAPPERLARSVRAGRSREQSARRSVVLKPPKPARSCQLQTECIMGDTMKSTASAAPSGKKTARKAAIVKPHKPRSAAKVRVFLSSCA